MAWALADAELKQGLCKAYHEYLHADAKTEEPQVNEWLTLFMRTEDYFARAARNNLVRQVLLISQDVLKGKKTLLDEMEKLSKIHVALLKAGCDILEKRPSASMIKKEGTIKAHERIILGKAPKSSHGGVLNGRIYEPGMVVRFNVQ